MVGTIAIAMPGNSETEQIQNPNFKTFIFRVFGILDLIESTNVKTFNLSLLDSKPGLVPGSHEKDCQDPKVLA